MTNGACTYLAYSSRVLASARSGADPAVCSDANIYRVANAGDINGDGQGDPAVGTTDDIVGVFLAQGLASALHTIIASDADLLLSGSRVKTTAGLGDVDVGGLSGLNILSMRKNSGATGHLPLGKDVPLMAPATELRDVVTATISMPSRNTAFQVRSVRDVNGTGYSDIMLVNVHDFTDGSGARRTHLIYGRLGGLGESPLVPCSIVDPWQVWAHRPVAPRSNPNAQAIDRPSSA